MIDNAVFIQGSAASTGPLHMANEADKIVNPFLKLTYAFMPFARE